MYENVILIPYRNRDEHLKYFLENSWKIIKENLPNTKLVILEQANNQYFNRGLLLNIGFKEYENKTKYFFTHDVDLNPLKNTIIDLYTKPVLDNQVIGIYTSWANTLGGIIKMKSDLPRKINGFPNNFWGWGVEDKAFQNRCETYNISISKNILNNDPNRINYFNIFDDINDKKLKKDYYYKTKYEYRQFNELTYENKIKHILSSGLSNLEYKIISVKNIDNDIDIDHILIDF